MRSMPHGAALQSIADEPEPLRHAETQALRLYMHNASERETSLPRPLDGGPERPPTVRDAKLRSGRDDELRDDRMTTPNDLLRFQVYILLFEIPHPLVGELRFLFVVWAFALRYPR